MRKMMYVLFGVLFLATFSCRDDDDDSGTGGGSATVATGKCIINANISGNISTTFNSDINLSTTVSQEGYVAMVGIKMKNTTTASTFQVWLPKTIGVGTYSVTQLLNMGVGSAIVYVDNSSDSSTGYVAGAMDNNNFTLKVTSSGGGKLEGTFTGDMININNKKITVSGDFKGAY